ncbi:kinase-like domain-containing protein [Gongronella butleri]|nr:kinase-like domain-containing protein [Gongronella butleri]
MPAKTNSHCIDPPSILGTCIDNGRIKLMSILGVGAYGIVYLAQHTRKPHKKYAAKLLSNTKVSRSEVDIHAQLADHDNILSFEKVVKHDGYTFMVLEYAPGGDLFAGITHPVHGLVGNDDAIRYIFLQILDAVEYCHQHGVAHRDLKPENILMFPNWRVKLADFGLATTQSVSTEFGFGSTFYFSPECQSGMVRNNQRIKGYSTQKNDIWSLGVILVNFTTGRNPWKQANMDDATFAAFVQNPKHFFRRILPKISEELDAILCRIFCLDPALRISLPELRLKIQKCQSFTRNAAAPAPLPPPPAPTTLRHFGSLRKNPLASLFSSSKAANASPAAANTARPPTPPSSSSNAPLFSSSVSSINSSSATSLKQTRQHPARRQIAPPSPPPCQPVTPPPSSTDTASPRSSRKQQQQPATQMQWTKSWKDTLLTYIDDYYVDDLPPMPKSPITPPKNTHTRRTSRVSITLADTASSANNSSSGNRTPIMSPSFSLSSSSSQSSSECSSTLSELTSKKQGLFASAPRKLSIADASTPTAAALALDLPIV